MPMVSEISHDKTDAPEPLTRYFSLPVWGVYALFIVVGLLLRWVALTDRPFHHDESLHGMYGKYFFDWPDHNYYKYTPMLHGPFLYNLYRVVYNTLGQSDWAARAPIAFIGSLFLFLPLVFRQYLAKRTVLALTAVVAFSPTLAYWARFLREDTVIVGCMALMLYGVLCAKPSLKALFVLSGLTLQFCIKENAYVTVAILLGYLVFEACFAFALRIEGETLVSKMWLHLKRHKLAFFNALALCVFVYCYLYSAGFRYSQGILDGLYRESISYWMHHHNIERISGPFLFHFYMLSWYETFFILAFFVHLYFFYRHAPSWAMFTGLAVLVCAIVLGMQTAQATLGGTNTIGAGAIWNLTDINCVVWRFFKLKDSYDVVGLIVLLVHPLIVTIVHLLRRERALAFWGYLFTATFFSYSYLGEKVPWLSVYPFVAGIVYLAIFFERLVGHYPQDSFEKCHWRRLLVGIGIAFLVLGFLFVLEGGGPADLPWMGVGVVFFAAAYVLPAANMLSTYRAYPLALTIFCLYTLRASILTNFVYAGDAREYISQVHTTAEYNSIMNSIKAEIDGELRGYRPQVFVTGEATWPSTWYMRGYPNEYKFSASDAERNKFHYMVLDWKEGEPTKVPDGFRTMRINLRGWWVPDFRQMTLKNFLGYALNHTNWSPTGYSYVTLVVNPQR
ncbi:MAG: TIGR03663 family protein [Oligoflexia bacterium]|nr:TIGR03663 family protein [Oligoflexia bacterium]